MVEQELLEPKIFEQKISFIGDGLLCAVADGMGGHRGGDVASRQALEALATESPRLTQLKDAKLVGEHLEQYIQNIHRELLERGDREPELSGMGTTLLGVYLHPDFALCFHAGDSRLYRYRGGTLMQLTSDHSPEVIFGTNFADSAHNRKSGTILNCLGGDAVNCSPEIKEISFREKDILLLCSDGLSDMVELETMDILFDQELNLPETAWQLIAEANKSGGLDNITVVLIKKEGEHNG